MSVNIHLFNEYINSFFFFNPYIFFQHNKDHEESVEDGWSRKFEDLMTREFLEIQYQTVIFVWLSERLVLLCIILDQFLNFYTLLQ